MNKKEKLIAATMIFIAIRSIKKAKKKPVISPWAGEFRPFNTQN